MYQVIYTNGIKNVLLGAHQREDLQFVVSKRSAQSCLYYIQFNESAFT